MVRLTKDEIERINDLKIQAMLFDMDIDWETMTLITKAKKQPKTWLDKFKERQNESDYTVIDNGF